MSSRRRPSARHRRSDVPRARARIPEILKLTFTFTRKTQHTINHPLAHHQSTNKPSRNLHHARPSSPHRAKKRSPFSRKTLTVSRKTLTVSRKTLTVFPRASLQRPKSGNHAPAMKAARRLREGSVKVKTASARAESPVPQRIPPATVTVKVIFPEPRVPAPARTNLL